MGTALEQIATTSTEVMVWEEPAQKRVKKRLGKHALAFEGFTPLQTVESPYNTVRDELEDKIVEQPEAINAIIEALERSEIRLPNDKRPIANLAFLGPTGVGKSETAKVLSRLLGKGEGNLIKIDCSNFSHGHEVSSLTGSPPGFVGHDKKPALEKERVEKPGTVILFDEIEKGATELYNLMLQIMGDGELKLNNGQTTSFRDTVIILTSNLGAKEMSAQLSKTPFGLGATKQEVSRGELEKTATKSFEKFFTPEFINRLNKMVVFHPLSTEGLGSVLDVKVSEANEEYEKQLGVRLSLSDATRTFLTDIALKEPHMGARPLVRALEDNVQTSLGRYVGSGHVQEGTHVRVFHISEAPENYPHADDSELIFTAKADPTIEKESTVMARIEADAAAMAALPANALPANPADYYSEDEEDQDFEGKPYDPEEELLDHDLDEPYDPAEGDESDDPEDYDPEEDDGDWPDGE